VRYLQAIVRRLDKLPREVEIQSKLAWTALLLIAGGYLLQRRDA